MMSKLFLQAVKLCLSASIVTGLVLILRLALKKAPKSLICALWILVGLRLMIPAMPSSKVSVIPEAVSGGTAVEALEKQYVEDTTVIRKDQNEELYEQITELYTDLPVYQEKGTSYVVVAGPAVQAAAPASAPSSAQSSVQSAVPAAASYTPPKTFGDSVVPALSVVWIAGVGVMLLFMIGSYLRLYRRLHTAVIREKGVWESDQISSPCILGILRPRIYLPMSLSEEERQFVLAHERTHIRRGDQIWKPLSFVLLAVYWFNPLFWLAYFLVCRDIESACDESVIRSEGTAYRKAYSETLLKLNVRQKAVTACPLAFAENSVGGRIRSILNYKKPAFWLVVTALVISVVAAGCALTDPTKKESSAAESTEQTESEASTEESTAPESTEAVSTDPAETTEAVPSQTETEPAPSETAEKSSYFDTLYVNGKALDADELKKLASFLENDYQPLPWAFLGQAFRDPSEIDVIDLFYNWTEELSGEAEQEAAWKAGHLEHVRLETQKRTAKGMNEAFRKYTGKDLTKDQTDAFSRWIYLPEYDAYYSFHTDSNLPGVALGRACLLDEKDAAHLGLKAGDEQLIALEWTALNNGSVKPADAGMLLLVPFEDSWQIVANIYFTEPATETDPAPTEPSAETEPVSAERTACTTVLLEGRATVSDFGLTKYEETGVTYYYSSIDSHAPRDFAVISENDIVILDSVAMRLQRYKDGKYFETISLPYDTYCRLCVIGEKAHVITSDSLVTVDLNTKEQTTIPLPNPEGGANFFGSVYVSNMLEQDGKLYLVSEMYGNYCLNEETGGFEKPASARVPYRSYRLGGIEGKEIRVEKGDRRWTIEAANRYGDVIGFGEDGIVYFYLYDLNLNREDEGYCRILKCAAGGGGVAESFVDVSKCIETGRVYSFAKVAPDGSVYVLALYEDSFAVYKLNVGVEDIVSP